MANPTTLLLPRDRQVIGPNGLMTPQWWEFFASLQTGLTTVDLTSQVIGILPIVNGGTGDNTASVPAGSLTGTALAANVVTASITGVNGADFSTTAYTDYTATSVITGWASFTAGRKGIFYKQLGKHVWVHFHLEGPSNSTSATFTLPLSARAGTTNDYGFGSLMTFTQDNGITIGPGVVAMGAAGGATAICYPSLTAASTGWTNANTKIVEGSFWYETS